MKRILLLMTVALIAISVSAKEGLRKTSSMSFLANEKKEVLVAPGAYKNYAMKAKAINAFYQTPEMKVNSKLSGIVKRANRAGEEEGDEEEVPIIPCYSTWTYHYSELWQGWGSVSMYDGASFAVTDDYIAFFPFANLGYVVGERQKGVENPYSELGGEQVTFNVGVIASFTNTVTGENKSLSLEPCVIDSKTYVPSRSGEKTFTGYYFPEDNELYLPSDVTLALFDADDETQTEIFSSVFVVRRLYLQPQAVLNEMISTGTAKGDSYYGEDYGFSNDNAQILLGDGVYFVKGANDVLEDSWVEFDVDENDETILIVEELQYLGTGSFYEDETRTTTYDADIATIGAYSNAAGELEAFTSDYSSSYKITDNADETTTITNTNNTWFGEYMYTADNKNAGMYNWLSLTININYIPIETGIKEINTTQSVKKSGEIYNLNGQKVNSNHKGIVIRDGKKMIQK